MATRGQMIRRGEHRWLLRIFLGRDAQGKRQYSAKVVEGTRKEARAELTKMHGEADTKTFVGRTTETLGHYLKRWLKGKLDVSARTLHDYTMRVNKYVIPAIGHVKLQQLSPLAVNELYAKWTKERGFSPRHVVYTHAVLHHALEQAVDWGLLSRNATRHATLPRKVRRAPTVLSPDQMAKLLETAQNDSLRALWCLLLTSGLRPGEALALRWSDLSDGAVTVRRTLVSDGKGHYSVAESQAKTKESIRSVSLPRTTLDAFKTHRARQNAEMLLAGERYQRQDFIFAGATGAWLSPDNVRKRWKTLLKRASLPKVRLYDTRHSHATALLTKGVNLAWVSERLGHTDVKMTKEVYAHVLPEAHKEMADVMEQIVGKRSREA